MIGRCGSSLVVQLTTETKVGVRFESRKSHNNSWPRWAIKAHNKHNTCRVEVAGIE